jgi:subtilisin family serine protease
MRRTDGLLVSCLGAFALAIAPLVAQQPGSPGEQRGNQDPPRFHRHGPNRIANQYIVVLDEDAQGPEADPGAAAARAEQVIQRTPAGRLTFVYSAALSGFAAEMTEEEAVALSRDPDVLFVEEDSVVEAFATQTNATWGLDRIDQRDRPLNGTYSYTSTGSGVNVYIIDTGIRRTHTQFGGRAFVGFDAIRDGRNTSDCNGHGTHVAGTVGGSTYGVAKAVRLFAVRVLNCSGSGTTSGVIAGIDWVTRNRIRPAVANMSLGGGASSSLDTAGATTSTDARSSFSNFGSVVDIFAPGSSITSAWSTSDTATRTISGTSMATPHVAGVAARYLQSNTTASAATVRNAIVNAATLNRLSGIPSGTANRLLFWSPSQ